MDIALIGYPQSGKKTLLNGLTRGRAESSTSGSAQQEVRTGVAKMLDPRLDTVAEIFGPNRVLPAEIKYLAIPSGSGITVGTAGIAGQSMNLLQSADALLHVVRAFEDPAVPHMAGGVDPYRDAVNMDAELALSDLAILERRVERIQTSLKGASGHERDLLMRETTLLQRLKDSLESDVPVREQHLLPEDMNALSDYQLLTAKPMLVVFNIGEAELSRAADLEEELARPWVEKPGVGVATVSCKLEMELSQLSPEDEREFRESIGLQTSGLDRVARLSYELLSLVSFFTYVSKEVRAWTVPAFTPASKAAGKIHSDMERGFIRAEVIAFDDLARCGSLAQCRREGVLHLEGKTYQVKDGDVITFLFNV